MDISPRQEPRHTHDSLSPTLFPSPSSHQHHPAASSNSHLATLLAEAYRDAESLRKELSNTRRALEKAERVYQLLEEAAGSSSVATGTTPTTTTATTPPTTNGDQQQQQQQQQQKYHHLLNNPTALRSVIDQYEKLLAQSQADRARAEERQREALDAVRMLDDLLSALDKEGKAVTRPILEAASMLSPSLSTMRSMAPPPGLPNSRSRAAGNSAAGAPGSGASNAPGRLAPFSLPPHPTPIRTHSPSGSTSSRRPRTPSVDSMYGAAAPPNKKARPAGDDPSTSRGREPRVAYSEPVRLYSLPLWSRLLTLSFFPFSFFVCFDLSFIFASYDALSFLQYIPGEYNNRPILPLPQRSSAASESMAGPRSLDANNNNKYNINGSGGGAANHQRRAVASTHRPNHARSESHSSASSMDVDEMIFKATVGDEIMNNGVVNGRHPAYTGSPHHGSQHLMNSAPTMTRAGTKRALMMGDEDALSVGTESPRGRALSLSNNHSPYPGGYPPSNASSSSMRGPIPPGNNANSNGGGAGQGNQGSAGGSSSGSHVYTTHVFAPPMTGAPTKKPKFPNSVMGGGASSSLVGSGGGGSMGGVGGSAVGSMSAGMGGGGRGGSSPGVAWVELHRSVNNVGCCSLS
ncbi:hypothetical protein D9613_011230 [Agrocybe pediades]|uniref:Uncharacterized protein n=1 Tax=Agrocybe pediades TaxID=84607 RepID=A0A8H4QRY7_9AGAR|nr:hypothetical protein D9613_011230 [Agrocybe pediades]